MKDSYIRHVILEHMLDGNFDVQFEDGWIQAEDLEDIKARTGFEAFAGYGLRVGNQYQDIVEEIFSHLLAQNGIATRGDQYAGFWFKLNIAKKNEIGKKLVAENPASKIIISLPEAALENALDQIAEEDGLGELYVANSDEAVALGDLVEAEIIPGSDRFVSLSHNQAAELDGETTKLIDAVESLNAIDGDTGLRATVIGGLKAGRELIRAGAFKLYALEATLIEALKFLVKRYEREAIGALAVVLLSALTSHLGIPV